MKYSELAHVTAALLVLTVITGLSSVINGNPGYLSTALLFSLIILITNIGAKKLMANSLDAGVQHRIWSFRRYGFKPHWKFKNPIPTGVIFPLFFSAFSLGAFKLMTLLTYEVTALKRRAAKRFGPYSHTEITEWHNSLIGAAGIVALFILAIFTYSLPYQGVEILSKWAIYYAFFNMLPLWNFDGTQIFFGSRILYSILAAITIFLTLFAFVI